MASTNPPTVSKDHPSEGRRRFGDGLRPPIALYRRHESVATPGKRFDIDGVVGRVSQGFAQLVDGLVQALLIIHERAVGPKTPLEVLAGNDLTGLFQQRLQDLEWLLLHFQTDAVFVELASLKVELEYAEPLL